MPKAGIRSASQLTNATFGSGDAISFTYNANTGRMTQYNLAINGTGTYGNLTWNANGTLQQLAITDPFNSADAQTCTYLYDDLGRVGLPPGSTGKSVDCGASIWQQNFSYDAFGNLTKTIPSGGTGISWQPTYGSSTNRYTAIPGASPSYDADGNLTNDSFHTYTWDAEARPVSIDSLSLTYDALGRMVEVKNGTNYTQYVWWPSSQKFVIMNGQNLSSAFVPLPGGAEVKYTSSGLSVFRMPDWLGSLRAASNLNRTYNGSLAFAPFGERYGVSGTPAYAFTGQRADTVSDEYDFVFRKYHSTQGRWISPDPAGLDAVDPSSPQTWNRYAYVMNNPVSYRDSLGLFLWVGRGEGDAGNGNVGGSVDPCFLYPMFCFGDMQRPIFPDFRDPEPPVLRRRNPPPKNAANTATPKNPCADASAANLDYSENKQHIIDEHLAWFQGKPAPSMTSSQYMFEGSITTVDQAWTQIMAFNAYSFTNPEQISQVGNAYRFTASYPLHPPAAYTGFERRRFETIFGIPFYSSWRTTNDTVVVRTDCKTVQTSYPGNP